MMRLIPLLCLSLFVSSAFSQNIVPIISNLQVSVDNSNQMTITYDLADAENDEVEITFRISDDAGETFVINTTDATGDLGFPISPGSGKSISWDFSNAIDMDGNYKVMLVADDLQAIDIQDIVDQVDSNRLRVDLEFIEGIRHRTAGAVHLQEVKDLIANHFDDHDLETEVVQFDHNGYLAENFIGRKPGLFEETETYIIDGHYDTVDESPGADDNGSAIAGVMEALRILAPYQFKKTIKFIGFDLEEAGLLGSIHHVDTEGIKAYENIAGVFNFEMIGYYDNSPNSQTLPFGFDLLYPDVYNDLVQDEFRGNFITNVGIVGHPELNEAFESAANTYVPDLRVISILAPANWLVLTPDLGRSDHAPFWLNDLPALMLTDGSEFRYPYYHSPNDTVGNLNFTFMSNVVKATVAAVAELAEISHSSFQTADIEVITNASDLLDCGVQIFPNPNSAFIRLDFSDCQSEAIAIKLFNIVGQLVHTRQLETLSGPVEIPTVDFPSGSYFLSIWQGGDFITKKVIISH